MKPRAIVRAKENEMDDPVCNVCGDRKSAHVATDKGPFTHPREARGEGHYEQVAPGHLQGGFYPGDMYEVGPSYRFVESKAWRDRARLSTGHEHTSPHHRRK